MSRNAAALNQLPSLRLSSTRTTTFIFIVLAFYFSNLSFFAIRGLFFGFQNFFPKILAKNQKNFSAKTTFRKRSQYYLNNSTFRAGRSFQKLEARLGSLRFWRGSVGLEARFFRNFKSSARLEARFFQNMKSSARLGHKRARL